MAAPVDTRPARSRGPRSPAQQVRHLEWLVAHRELQLLRGRRPAYVRHRFRLLVEARAALERARRRLEREASDAG